MGRMEDRRRREKSSANFRFTLFFPYCSLHINSSISNSCQSQCRQELCPFSYDAPSISSPQHTDLHRDPDPSQVPYARLACQILCPKTIASRTDADEQVMLKLLLVSLWSTSILVLQLSDSPIALREAQLVLDSTGE